MELEPKLYSKLPDVLINEICVLTGNFILRYDNKFKKLVLVSIINTNSKKWIEFDITLSKLYKKRKHEFTDFIGFGRRVSCTIGRNGGLISRVFLSVTLPPNLTKYYNN